MDPQKTPYWTSDNLAWAKEWYGADNVPANLRGNVLIFHFVDFQPSITYNMKAAILGGFHVVLQYYEPVPIITGNHRCSQ